MPTTTRVLGFTNGIQRLVWSGPAGTITAHLWGGGGGRGGSDRYGGGNGTGGGYSTCNFVVNDGDILDVAVGGAGGNGASGQGSGPGGTAGASYSLLLFNTRTTQATPEVIPVSNSGWGSFLNTYGVWENGGVATNFSRTYGVNFPVTTNYTFTFSADNYGTVYLDGVPVISLSSSSPDNYRNSYQVTISVSAGNHTLLINAVNTGGPGGVGLTISRTDGFSGGRGGRSGPAGTSGSGGGGGGATALFLNNALIAAAGGGGGGGGGGNYGAGQSAPGVAGTTAGVYNGQNGQDHPGDGGGGGGGGGGFQGGNGGAVGGGDVGGLAGSVGLSSAPGSNPAGTTPGGTDSIYYKSGTALGANANQLATSGYAAIVIETTGINVHSGGNFQAAKQIYVKDNGTWKTVKGVWIKDGGVWKDVIGSTPPPFDTIPNTIGVSSRPYS